MPNSDVHKLIELEGGSQVKGFFAHDITFKTRHGELKVKWDKIKRYRKEYVYSSERYKEVELEDGSTLRGEIKEEDIVIITKFGELKVKSKDILSISP